MQKSVTVVVTIRAKPGKEARIREELVKLLAPTRAEKGCLNYDMHESPADKALFLFHENWASAEDLERHLEQPHLLNWRKVSKDLLAEPLVLTRWQRVQ